MNPRISASTLSRNFVGFGVPYITDCGVRQFTYDGVFVAATTFKLASEYSNFLSFRNQRSVRLTFVHDIATEQLSRTRCVPRNQRIETVEVFSFSSSFLANNSTVSFNHQTPKFTLFIASSVTCSVIAIVILHGRTPGITPLPCYCSL